MYDGNKYETIDISRHPDPFDGSALAAKIRWFRWLRTSEGQRWRASWLKDA